MTKPTNEILDNFVVTWPYVQPPLPTPVRGGARPLPTRQLTSHSKQGSDLNLAPLSRPEIKGGQTITNSVQNWDSTRKIPGDIILLAHYCYLLLYYFFVVRLKTKKNKNALKNIVKLLDDQIILYEVCFLLQSAATYNTTDLLPHHQVTRYFSKRDFPCL